jgi:hypothetical protein
MSSITANPSTHSTHWFKTVYFPRERTRAGKSVRVTLSLPTTGNGTHPGFVSFLKTLSSRELRLTLGDPILEDLEERAGNEGRSLSNFCVRLLAQRFGDSAGPENGSQPLLPFIENANGNGDAGTFEREPRADVGVTFRESHRLGGHGWYPYVEGFSAPYVRDALLRDGKRPTSVYDPFGGAGTTQLTASCLHVPSFYSEINPFMAFVAETKVSSAAWAHAHFDQFQKSARDYLRSIKRDQLRGRARRVDSNAIEDAFPGRDFFEDRHLRELLACRDLALEIGARCPHISALLTLACAANAVRASNMTRRADLRRRREDEYKTRVVDVPSFVAESVSRMLSDIEHLPARMAPSTAVSDDCRKIGPEYQDTFELAVTSPPYLNGTNYFRNTKIELWLLGFIKSENDLAAFRRAAVAAGINNVVLGRKPHVTFPFVEAVASRLDEAADDARIPALVRQYFADMHDVLASVFRSLSPGGAFLMDIGDSKFYGVHVSTDRFLADVARDVGFTLGSRHVLARRYSRDKSDLIQVELVLRKPKRVTSRVFRAEVSDLGARTSRFGSTLPYRQPPFDSRAWGHKLHSLCSYQGKLKPGIAHWLVREFVPAAGRVLDPLGGVGTIPFEAALAGCEAVSNDKSPFASLIAKAKLDPPTVVEAEDAVASIEQRMASVTIGDVDYDAAEFGLNGRVVDYYHKRTLDEVLRARKVFLRDGYNSRADAFAWAALLHVLHGNRPYALSRISHPVTPFHPQGQAVYKPLIKKLLNRVALALGSPLPDTFVRGCGLYGDFRVLPEQGLGRFDVIITSPPFYAMRFDRPNWLRMWFCGWGESDFHRQSLTFIEREQVHALDCYTDLFRVSQELLKDTGIMIVHIGTGGKRNMADDLAARARDFFEVVADVVEDVRHVEQHGIRDKGVTTAHHFLFLRPLG